MKIKSIASYIDHTLLKPEASEEQIKTLCEEAVQYKFASVCVNPCRVKFCSRVLSGTGVKVCTVIGFPLGACTSETKTFEALNAIANGADELDMVINIGAVKDGDYDLVRSDIEAVVSAAKDKALVKVIIETCLLTDEEKVNVCKIVKEAGADFVKTSTGFSSAGASVKDVELMRKTVGDNFGVKAAGGIRSLGAAIDMINSGATRIGASASIKMVEEEQERK